MKSYSVIAFVIAVIVAAIAQNYFAGIVAFIIVSIFASKMPNEFQKIIDEIKKAIEQAKQGQQKASLPNSPKPRMPQRRNPCPKANTICPRCSRTKPTRRVACIPTMFP